MHPSLRLCSARVHEPLIKFVGKRVWPTAPDPPHAHPQAPTELKEHFSDFLKKFQASSHAPHPAAPPGVQPKKPASPSGVNVQHVERYGEFWEAPAQFWRPRVRTLEDWEIDAIQTGGASLR
ncbi:hypothetical protein GLOTRDRAFT_91246 [Gloeophyllum trabeum ATCC 11539]|uniref:Uncharacterized protein n=1 Tax=Gloeophyllum trabeum (strain ATCC 11539 / FP-39264 / Madison 617) TaxID=670483 RepID=S7RXT2_GLOTA|nr:uncharacterized protein GLOTRDRAFT_91246 [Gloeophyllum trabeum ATCC 11539]EPQ59745.1 hypothetical protein GLOTRDRAFT_91246 [Gloeophyllum trabeum ATCC 11539]